MADPQAPGHEPGACLPALPAPRGPLEALKPQPGTGWRIDDKFVAPLKGSRKKHYQFTAIHESTRIRVLRIYDRLNQTTTVTCSSQRPASPQTWWTP